MAKLDIKSAFRICPARVSDWNLLGISILGYFFVDLCLPFGLRSSVNRFTQLASTLLWIVQTNYGITNCTHYLDDFFLAGPPSSQQCALDMCKTIDLFSNLGVPLAVDKQEGPTSCITFLGIEINSANMSIRLPSDKLHDILVEISAWARKRKCTKRELLSLIGKLSFAAKVVPSGRIFLRRLIDLSTTVPKLSFHITLNSGARADIAWWANYLPTWNGRQRILDPLSTYCNEIELFTDASGDIGFGIFNRGQWISEQWPDAFRQRSIQWKELYPIFLSCLLWAPNFRGKRLIFHCDNMSIVNVWHANSSKCPHIMSLLRKLFFISAKNEFTVNVKHIAGIDNSIADSLSRLQLRKFFRIAPTACQHPTSVPPNAWEV